MSNGGLDLATEMQGLRDALNPMIKQFERLPSLLLRERDALKTRKPELLEKASEEVRATLEEIYKTDQLRQRLTARLGGHLGLRPNKLSLLDLDAALGGRSGLLPLREKLTAAIEKAETLNRENQAIFVGVLSATESLLRILKEGKQGPVSSYNRLGNRQSRGEFHFLSKQL